MRILPKATRPPEAVPARRHQPPRAPYGTFRDCLRWEHGFSCALCLVHESDLIEGGAEGTGLISIEHHETQRDSKQGRTDYRNCILACRFCNGTRSTKPIVHKSVPGVILDPTHDCWGDYFHAQNHRLEPVTIAVDAVRTEDAYGINDQRRMSFRRTRHEKLSECNEVLERGDELLNKLRNLAMKLVQEGRSEEAKTAFAAIEQLKRAQAAAQRDLLRWRVVPSDAPSCCRCETIRTRVLPDWLKKQCAERSSAASPTH